MIRLATFNVENLFDRPKILSLKDPLRIKELMDQVSELQTLIKQDPYSPADKQRIFALFVDLRTYIDIQEDVGKLFKRQGMAPVSVSASGASAWYGGIVFKRAQFGDQQRTNTATMLKKINADIQCLVEVEGNQALGDFNREMLARRFKQHLAIDSPNDPRGIDLGVYLRKATLGRLRTNAFDRRGNSSIWSRDCLEIECRLESGQSLFLLLNHFKSKFGGDTPASLERRKRQAERVIEIVSERYDPANDLYAVVGDLNDTPDSAAITPLMQSPLFQDVFDVTGHAADDRWTYYYHPNTIAKRRSQIDYVFVSPRLAGHVASVEVMRRGMTAVAEGRIPGVEPYPEFSSFRTAASDHAAVVVDLNL